MGSEGEKGWLEYVPEPWASKLKVEIHSQLRKAQFRLENAVGEEDYRKAREDVARMGFDPDGVGLGPPLEEELEDEDPIQGLGRNPVSNGIHDASANHDRYLYEGSGDTGGEPIKRGRRQFEVDLRKLDEKILDNDYAGELYAALCNNEWVNKGDPHQRYTCSHRYAGALLAFLRAMGEDYLDFYLDFDHPSTEVGVVSNRIESDLDKLGWVRQP